MVWGVIFLGGVNWWRVLALLGGEKGGFCFRTFNNTDYSVGVGILTHITSVLHFPFFDEKFIPVRFKSYFSKYKI